MNPFAFRWVAVAALLIAQIAHAGAPPDGILVREKGKDDCCATRLELTAGGQAFSLESGDPVTGTVTEIDGKLQVEMEGKIRWTLSREGNGWVDQEKRHWVWLPVFGVPFVLIFHTSSLGSFRFGGGSVLAGFLDRPATAFTLIDFHDLRKALRGGSMRAVEPQLPFFDFYPDTPLHLEHSEEAGLAAFLEFGERIGHRLVGIEMKYGNPLAARRIFRAFPFFDGKESMWHGGVG